MAATVSSSRTREPGGMVCVCCLRSGFGLGPFSGQMFSHISEYIYYLNVSILEEQL